MGCCLRVASPQPAYRNRPQLGLSNLQAVIDQDRLPSPLPSPKSQGVATRQPPPSPHSSQLGLGTAPPRLRRSLTIFINIPPGLVQKEVLVERFRAGPRLRVRLTQLLAPRDGCAMVRVTNIDPVFAQHYGAGGRYNPTGEHWQLLRDDFVLRLGHKDGYVKEQGCGSPAETALPKLLLPHLGQEMDCEIYGFDTHKTLVGDLFDPMPLSLWTMGQEYQGVPLTDLPICNEGVNTYLSATR